MSIQILLADDFEPWRRFVCSMIQEEPGLQIICEVSDGQAAIHKAKELKPDLILLDICLPKLNGIAAAREIRMCAPESKILFLTQESSADVMREALAVGHGFLVKLDAYMELLPGMKAIILDGRLFASRLAIYAFKQAGGPVSVGLQ